MISWGSWTPNYKRTQASYFHFKLLCNLTHTHTHAHARARAHTHTHKHKHKQTLRDHIFPNWKYRCILNSRHYFSLFKKSWKHCFPQRTSGLPKRIVNFTDSEMYILAKIGNSHNKFLNAKRLMLYHTIHKNVHLLSENHL